MQSASVCKDIAKIMGRSPTASVMPRWEGGKKADGGGWLVAISHPNFFLYFNLVDRYTYFMTKEEYLQSLSREPSSEDSTRAEWYNSMNTMAQEAYKTNPTMFRPTYIGNDSGHSFVSPESTAADYNYIAPALQETYGTPENYMIEGYKNLEQEAKNPKDYYPSAIERRKKTLLEQLYPQLKS